MTFESSSSLETKRFAADLARRIAAEGPGAGATVVALEGDLGAGKTTFVQGFLSGLGVRKASPSPTFVLMRRTALNKGGFQNLIHMDAYRLKGPADLAALAFGEILREPRNLLLIEWADRIRGALPKSARRLRFRHGRHPDERLIDS